MALYPTYVDLEVARENLRIPEGDDSEDLLLGIAIESASRAIDHATNRQFGQGDAEARYYDGVAYGYRPAPGPWGDRCAVEIFDLMTTEDLVVKFDDAGDSSFSATVTDYDLWPWNAAADGKPWTHLVFRRSVSPPYLERSVEVTARWGWSAVPQLVTEACLLQVNRWSKRRDAAFGVAGSPDMGSELRLLAKLDPDVEVAIGALRRPWAAA